MATATKVIKAAKVIARGKTVEGVDMFVVESNTCPGNYYLLTWSSARSAWVCSCPAGRHNRSCSHVNAVNAHVFNERMAAVSASQARVRASLDHMEREYAGVSVRGAQPRVREPLGNEPRDRTPAELADMERQWSMGGALRDDFRRW